MSKNLKQKAIYPVTVGIENERGDDVVGFLDIANVEIEWVNGKSYFKMTLRFPDGSFRQLFIHEKALLTKSGAPARRMIADADCGLSAKIRKN